MCTLNINEKNLFRMKCSARRRFKHKKEASRKYEHTMPRPICALDYPIPHSNNYHGQVSFGCATSAHCKAGPWGLTQSIVSMMTNFLCQCRLDSLSFFLPLSFSQCFHIASPSLATITSSPTLAVVSQYDSVHIPTSSPTELATHWVWLGRTQYVGFIDNYGIQHWHRSTR